MIGRVVLILLSMTLISQSFAKGGAYDSRPIKEQGNTRFREKVKQDYVKISASSDIKIAHDKENKRIIIGRCEERDDGSGTGSSCNFLYAREGREFKNSVTIEIVDGVGSINLRSIKYKDHAIIKASDRVIFTSVGSEDFKWGQERCDEVMTDEPFDYYRAIEKNGEMIPVQTGRIGSASLGVNLKPLMENNKIRIDILVAAGYFGGYELVIDYSASSRFSYEPKENVYRCFDSRKTCTQGRQERIIEGVRVTRDCWQYGYTKTCDYPSKDDCGRFEYRQDCLFIQDRECILYDGEGNCVNVLREYSCKTGEDTYKVMRPKYISTNDDLSIPGAIKCSVFPCMEGICHNPHWDKDKDMPDSVSKLKIAQHTQGKDLENVRLFPGTVQTCRMGALGFKNCCQIKGMSKDCRKENIKLKGGWGKLVGNSCTKDEEHLASQRERKRCYYVGKVIKRRIGIKSGSHKKFCCFPEVLHKIIQVEGRKQLGKGWGDPKNPDCGGLTIEELMKIDFTKIDFSEAFPEFTHKAKEDERGAIKYKKRKFPKENPDYSQKRLQKHLPSGNKDGKAIHGNKPSQMNRPSAHQLRKKGQMHERFGTTGKGSESENYHDNYPIKKQE